MCNKVYHLKEYKSNQFFSKHVDLGSFIIELQVNRLRIQKCLRNRKSHKSCRNAGKTYSCVEFQSCTNLCDIDEYVVNLHYNIHHKCDHNKIIIIFEMHYSLLFLDFHFRDMYTKNICTGFSRIKF